MKFVEWFVFFAGGKFPHLRCLLSAFYYQFRTKNNPVLIGEPGVGKTAIAEGLAQRIVKRDVPASLFCRLYSLDMGALMAGAKYKGEYEERVKAVLNEIEKASENGPGVILFIDELHLIMAGSGSESAGMDAGESRRALRPFDLICSLSKQLTFSSPCWHGENFVASVPLRSQNIVNILRKMPPSRGVSLKSSSTSPRCRRQFPSFVVFARSTKYTTVLGFTMALLSVQHNLRTVTLLPGGYQMLPSTL